MGATEFTITGGAWVAITSAGVPASLWLKTKPLSGGVVIRHGPDTGLDNGLTLINSRKHVLPLFPADGTDIFYARCSDESATCLVCVDNSLGLVVPVESNGGIPVNLQDQTTRPFDIKLYQTVTDGLVLAAPIAINDTSATLEAGHGAVAGNTLVMLLGDDFFDPVILNVATNVVTFDSPSPKVFPIADTTVFQVDPDMNVNGSVTTKVCSLVNPFATPMDVTRLMITMLSSSPMDNGLFGSLSSLTNGVVFRKKKADGTYVHYWNSKNNGYFGLIAYDVSYDDKAPAGLYGIKIRITYAGQEKHGVVIRLEQNEAIELLVQDDLTDLEQFYTMVQGHLTTGN